MSNTNIENTFKKNLQEISKEKVRLFQLQKDIEEGRKKQEDLEANEQKLLKELYCEQIVELDNLIKYYVSMGMGLFDTKH